MAKTNTRKQEVSDTISAEIAALRQQIQVLEDKPWELEDDEKQQISELEDEIEDLQTQLTNVENNDLEDVEDLTADEEKLYDE